MSHDNILKHRILRDLLPAHPSFDEETVDRLVLTILAEGSATSFAVRAASELLAEKSTRIAGLEVEIAGLEVEISSLRVRLSAIENSNLWRVARLVAGRTPRILKRLLHVVIRFRDRLRRRLLALPPVAAASSSQGGVSVRDQKQAFRGKRIAIASLFRTRCGIRRGAELMVRDFRLRGIEVFAIDMSRPLGAKINADFPDLVPPSKLGELGVTDLIVHLNPPEFLASLKCFEPDALRASVLIGYWAWELPVISREWRESAKYCDELWVPSPFVKHALSSSMPRFAGAIKVVPHAVHRDPMEVPTGGQRVAVRKEYNLEPSAFVVGYAFSFDSNYSRKNPTAVIDAFRLAFPDDERCALIIRCSDGKGAPKLLNHLVNYAGTDRRIRIVDTDRSAFPIKSFYWCLDSYLAPFRSEGYGLNLMEAAQAGVTVIATSWGLAPDIGARSEVRQIGYQLVPPLDFQGFYDRFEGAVWAEPDLSDAVRELKLARESQLQRASHPGGAQVV